MSDKKNELKINDSLSDLLEDSSSVSKDPSSNTDLNSVSESNPNENIFEKSKSIKKLNKIIITRSAYNKMVIIAQEVSKLLNQSMEVYALCIGDNGVIEDILIPHQKVSSISIHINASDILSLAPYIRENNLNILGWAHSHGNMSVFFSSTDDNNQITVLNDTSNYTEIDNIRVKYCFGITVNLREELFGIVTTQFPSGNIAHEKAIFQVNCDLPANWNENEIRKEISEELKIKIKKNMYNNDKNNNYKFTDNFDNNDDNTKIKEKNLLSERDHYLIDVFLKRNNISNPKIKKLLISFVRFNNLNKNWKKKERRDRRERKKQREKWNEDE